ncbi:hypothetical protein N0V86_006929 [Didymella sp. IMI 355093]|nr:hypothetical protein N0V86_006929 [Didymella sp. IMI 355093]
MNRVRLEVPEGANDYINASPIELITTRSKTRLRYIATQGPKADTWSHFWRMLWHETQSPAVVVMVTKTHEQGREKCYPYYPQSTSDPILRVNEHDEFEDGFVNDLYLIKLAHDQEAHTEVREIDMVAEDGSMSRKVWHLLFEGWPDFSVPEDINKPALLEMIKLARAKNGPDNPLIVHCSAGIGRSGTFIALDWLMRELQEGSLDKLPDDEDPIMRCIDLLRDQRPMMVQSKQQFNFIYDVLREQWRKRWIELHPEKAMHIGIRSNEEAAADESNSKRRKRCRDGDDDGYFVAN